MTTVSTSSRIRGSLYGVAIVDALGGPVEFRRRGTFPLVTGFRYNSNFNLAPGTWTDDTSMTLCLAQSLVEEEGTFVLHDQVRKYVQWKEDGYMSANGSCFDIGNATREALGIWEECMLSGKEADALDLGHYQGIIDQALNQESSCGNGSLMRCAPIPLVYHRNSALAQKYAAEASLPTHPHPTCQQACQIYTHLIVQIMHSCDINSKQDIWLSFQGFINGFGPDEQLSPAIRDTLGRYKHLSSFVETTEENIRSSGYVVHTLEAAVWAFFTTETFKEGALKVVNLGDDADTVGAVYGGIAGAWYGVEAIPQDWRNGLQARKMVDDVVEGVVKLVERGGYA